MMKQRVLWLLMICIIVLLLGSGCVHDRGILRVATTTSLYDTGLLDRMEEVYEAETGVDLQIISQGSGKAIELAKRGDVDLLLIHSPEAEASFMEQGDGRYHRCFAYNYLLLLGPQEDPAAVKNLSVRGAFLQLYRLGTSGDPSILFVSRGDGSGTHHAEIRIWGAAGIDYARDLQGSGPWYIETGKGMGESLLIANEKGAYILADTGTYLAFRSRLGLVPLISHDEELLNRYSAIVIDRTKHPDVHMEEAEQFVNWLLSDKGRQILAEFGEREFGAPLFIPISEESSGSTPFNCSSSPI